MSTKSISKETLVNTLWQSFETASAMNHGIKFLMIMLLIKFYLLSELLLKDFLCHFPNKKINNETKAPWITIGINTSCVQKRKLYLACRNSTNPNVKSYYKCYCKIISKVIKEAKIYHYDNKIKNSTNKKKTTCHVVNKGTQRKRHSKNIMLLTIDGITTDNQQLIAESLITTLPQ